jgi:hypothetical protein
MRRCHRLLTHVPLVHIPAVAGRSSCVFDTTRGA